MSNGNNVSSLGSITDITWMGKGFERFQLVKIASMPDGSCFIHSLCAALYVSYRTGIKNNKPISKREIARNLRHELAVKLDERIDPLNPKSLTYYDTLGNGEVATLGKTVADYSLISMKAILDSSANIGHEFFEYISDILKVDLYFLSEKEQDVYPTADELSAIYKNRDSIIMIHSGDHFDLIGLKSGAEIYTIFKPENELILFIRSKLATLSK